MRLFADYPQTYPQQLWTRKKRVLAEITGARYITTLILALEVTACSL